MLAKGWRALVAALIGALVLGASPSRAQEGGASSTARFTIGDGALHQLEDRVFGQFLERASWGEWGPEAALADSHAARLQPSVLERLEEMDPPLVRFPGGTDVDYMDWRDAVSNVPGRTPAPGERYVGGRPVSTGRDGHTITNRFGYDEFLQLAERLGTETLLVVNFRAGLLGEKPLEEAARDAATLVAYANARIGASLPEGMADWPAVRTQNGRRVPYGVEFFEIGNEAWLYLDELKEQGLTTDEAIIDRYVRSLDAYITAMRAVDPHIEIIVDAQPEEWNDLAGLVAAIREGLGDRVDYLAYHRYTPWGIEEVLKDGEPVALDALRPADVWGAWTAVPEVDPATGQAVLTSTVMEAARRHGYPLAMTEWNFNGGWWGVPERERPFDSEVARGLGVAGFLHAFIRAGDVVKLGSQSLLVGAGVWNIDAIRVDTTGQAPAYFRPTGRVTMFYAQHHGPDVLPVAAENVPTYRQPFAMRNIRPAEKVATLDAVATADERRVYFHVVNRHFDRAQRVEIDASALGLEGGEATLHVLEPRPDDEADEEAGRPRGTVRLRSEAFPFDGETLAVTLPPQTVSVVVFRR